MNMFPLEAFLNVSYVFRVYWANARTIAAHASIFILIFNSIAEHTPCVKD